MADSSLAENSPQLLNLVGQVLEGSRVRWGAIGALAVAYHGWVRASMDADALITLRDSDVNMEELLRRLRIKGWQVEYRDGGPGDPLGFVVRIQDDRGNQVDLIGAIRNLDSKFFERTVEADLGGLSLAIASPEDLIALKVYAGGPKHLEDAAGVLEILGPDLNRELLRSLCRGFGPEELERCERLLAGR
jgi:hypothetical protein